MNINNHPTDIGLVDRAYYLWRLTGKSNLLWLYARMLFFRLDDTILSETIGIPAAARTVDWT